MTAEDYRNAARVLAREVFKLRVDVAWYDRRWNDAAECRKRAQFLDDIRPLVDPCGRAWEPAGWPQTQAEIARRQRLYDEQGRRFYYMAGAEDPPDVL